MGRKANTQKAQTNNAAASGTKNNHPFSQFAWRKSIVVSNALMRAVRFDETDTEDINAILAGSLALQESFEVSPTGRKDASSQAESKANVTIAAGRYHYRPVGTDAVTIVFDIKVVNATHFPQSAKIDTWKAVVEKTVNVAGTPMTVHQALTCKAKEIFGLVAGQIFSCEWAWRNREEATVMRLIVKDEAGRVLKSSHELAEAMYQAFSTNSPALWRVAGVFKLGAGASIRAYPSQLFKQDGSEMEKKTAEFYKIPGTEDFGMRAVKIGNRLKTIDTWYENHDFLRLPIPVEPMGYFHALRTCLRNRDIAVNLMTNAISGTGEWSENDALYMNAITLFGGLLTAEDNNTNGVENNASNPADDELSVIPENASVPDGEQMPLLGA